MVAVQQAAECGDAMKLLDLFCGAGGCTKGYQRAGFYVRGVDKKNQPRYCGDEFMRADAIDYLRMIIDSGEINEFDVIHASPPCQEYSSLASLKTKTYDKLIQPVRDLLLETGKPYVIENVPGTTLCFYAARCLGFVFNVTDILRQVSIFSLLRLVVTITGEHSQEIQCVKKQLRHH